MCRYTTLYDRHFEFGRSIFSVQQALLPLPIWTQKMPLVEKLLKMIPDYDRCSHNCLDIDEWYDNIMMNAWYTSLAEDVCGLPYTACDEKILKWNMTIILAPYHDTAHKIVIFFYWFFPSKYIVFANKPMNHNSNF